ncbi:hypothetical protein EC988_009912, partial [Linderina pennispora]
RPGRQCRRLHGGQRQREGHPDPRVRHCERPPAARAAARRRQGRHLQHCVLSRQHPPLCVIRQGHCAYFQSGGGVRPAAATAAAAGGFVREPPVEPEVLEGRAAKVFFVRMVVCPLPDCQRGALHLRLWQRAQQRGGAVRRRHCTEILVRLVPRQLHPGMVPQVYL